MEVLNEDIRSNKSVDLVRQFKSCILDTAKNIKSNDNTFSISSLPEVCDPLTQSMSIYIDSIKRIESAHNAFMKLSQDIDICEESDLNAYEELFRAQLEVELDNVHPEELAHSDLSAIIAVPQPRDEEIVVEAPSQKQWPRDPITKTNIQVAVRNRICKHTYDQSSIEQYINRQKPANTKKQKTPCPVAGCQNKSIELKDLEPDVEANALIESLKSSQ